MSPVILVAEDDPDVAHSLSVRLGAAGYDVRLAPNGQALLSEVALEVPQAILLDVRLPDVDGLTALAQLRNQPALRDTPVIVLSASSDPRHRRQALALKARYLVKPCDGRELLSNIAAILKPAPAPSDTPVWSGDANAPCELLDRARRPMA